MNAPEKWPPVYDFETLVSQIKELVSNYRIFDVFFQNDIIVDAPLCQGDIVKFKSPFPIIDAEGGISTIDEEYSDWIIIGNTCDLTRDIHDVEFSHLSPLIELRPDEPETILAGLKAYSSYKKFYILSWTDKNHPGYYLDFSHMCSTHKSCLFNTDLVNFTARMGRYSWLLFHSCIVRYLARDDGRHE